MSYCKNVSNVNHANSDVGNLKKATVQNHKQHVQRWGRRRKYLLRLLFGSYKILIYFYGFNVTYIIEKFHSLASILSLRTVWVGRSVSRLKNTESNEKVKIFCKYLLTQDCGL